jgi:hypothetical protein
MLAASLGWLGTAGTFVAYLLLWRGRLTAQSRRYALLNVTGGLMAGLASASYGAWPSAVSNFVWAAVGLHSVLGGYLARRSSLLAAARVATVHDLRRRLHGREAVCVEIDAA